MNICARKKQHISHSRTALAQMKTDLEDHMWRNIQNQTFELFDVGEDIICRKNLQYFEVVPKVTTIVLANQTFARV